MTRLVLLWIAITASLALCASSFACDDHNSKTQPSNQPFTMIGFATTNTASDAQQAPKLIKADPNTETPVVYGPAEPVITNFMALSRALEFGNLIKKQPNLNPNWRSAQTFYLTQEKSQTINVYIQSYPGHPEVTTWIQESFLEWKKALGDRLKLKFIDTPESAQIQMVWVKKDDMDEKTRLAETLPNIGFSYITVVKPSENFVSNNPYAELAIRAVLMHEFGHALGITDHSEDEEDLMATYINMEYLIEKYSVSSRPTLSQKDIEAIQTLYSPKWQPGQDLYQ